MCVCVCERGEEERNRKRPHLVNMLHVVLVSQSESDEFILVVATIELQGE